MLVSKGNDPPNRAHSHVWPVGVAPPNDGVEGPRSGYYSNDAEGNGVPGAVSTRTKPVPVRHDTSACEEGRSMHQHPYVDVVEWVIIHRRIPDIRRP